MKFSEFKQVKESLTLAQHNALSPIDQFKENLKNSTDMGDRKQAVQWLADKIGVEKANEVAKENGLKSSYYMAK